MSKVKGHWRTVDGKRVWVEEHTRAGLSGVGGGGATPTAVGLAGRIPTNPQGGSIATIQNKTAQLDEMLEQTNAKIQERRQTLQKLDKDDARDLIWDITAETVVLDALADHPHTDVQHMVSIHPRTSGATLDRLATKLAAPTRSPKANETNTAILAEIVHNSNVEAKTLERLATQAPPPHSSVLTNLARNPNAPAAALEALRSHPSPQVRAAIATQASVRGETERQLAQDESPDVRASVARNRNTEPPNRQRAPS